MASSTCELGHADPEVLAQAHRTYETTIALIGDCVARAQREDDVPEGGLHWDEQRQRWIATANLGFDSRGKRITRKASGRTKTDAKNTPSAPAATPRPSHHAGDSRCHNAAWTPSAATVTACRTHHHPTHWCSPPPTTPPLDAHNVRRSFRRVIAATGLNPTAWTPRELQKNFMDAVPIDLEEAAWTDGASPMQALRRIVLPLMWPGIAVVALYTFIGLWGNFFVPFVLLLSNDNLPASVSIYTFSSQYAQVVYGQLAAYSMLYSLPAVLLYLMLSRRLSGAFTFGGAVKG